jgi:hypothetical protein
MLDSQPRVAIPIILQKTTDNSVRNKFIDACVVKNPSLVENGILRVTKMSLD